MTPATEMQAASRPWRPWRLGGGGPSLARTARQVAALGGETFRECLHLKAFAVPAAFMATAVVLSPFLPTDGTPSGAVRLAISVSLLTATLFGTLTALMLASLVAARETRDRTGYLLATKPVPRWGLFAGRALGLSAAVAALFAGMVLLSWAFIRYTAAREAAGSEPFGAVAPPGPPFVTTVRPLRDLPAPPPGLAGRSRRRSKVVTKRSRRTVVHETLVMRARVLPVRETGPVRSPHWGPGGPLVLAPQQSARWRFALPGAGGRRDRPVEARLHLTGKAPPAGGIVVRAHNPGTGESGEVAIADDASAAGGSSRFIKPGEETLRLLVPPELVYSDPGNPRKPGVVDIAVENAGFAPVLLEGPSPVTVLAGSHAGVPKGGTYRWEFSLPARGYGGDDLVFKLSAHRSWNVAQELELEFRRVGASAARAGAEEVVRRKATLGPEGRARLTVPASLLKRPASDGPARRSAPSGRAVLVSVTMRNLTAGNVRVPVGDGLVFAPRSGTLLGALVRWGLLETAKAVFLVVVVCAGATVLSSPIPALLGGTIAAGGYLISFVMTLTAPGGGSGSVRVMEVVLRAILPDLAGMTAASSVASGVVVPAGLILRALLLLVIVRGGVVAVIGGCLAERREVGA